MGVIGTLSYITQKKLQNLKDRKNLPARIDYNLPYDKTMYGIVGIDNMSFSVYKDKLLIKDPGRNHTIVAIGSFTWDNMKIYKYYMNSNDGKNIGSLLWVTMKNNEIISTSLYCNYEEIENPDWDEWLNKKNGLIGFKDFNVNDDGKAFTYVRSFGDLAFDYFDPIHYKETVILDPYGLQGFEIDGKAMIYSREVEEGFEEYVLLACEEIFDDGESKDAKINIMVGIDLLPSEIT